MLHFKYLFINTLKAKEYKAFDLLRLIAFKRISKLAFVLLTAMK